MTSTISSTTQSQCGAFEQTTRRHQESTSGILPSRKATHPQLAPLLCVDGDRTRQQTRDSCNLQAQSPLSDQDPASRGKELVQDQDTHKLSLGHRQDRWTTNQYIQVTKRLRDYVSGQSFEAAASLNNIKGTIKVSGQDISKGHYRFLNGSEQRVMQILTWCTALEDRIHQLPADELDKPMQRPCTYVGYSVSVSPLLHQHNKGGTSWFQHMMQAAYRESDDDKMFTLQGHAVYFLQENEKRVEEVLIDVITDSMIDTGGGLNIYRAGIQKTSAKPAAKAKPTPTYAQPMSRVLARCLDTSPPMKGLVFGRHASHGRTAKVKSSKALKWIKSRLQKHYANPIPASIRVILCADLSQLASKLNIVILSLTFSMKSVCELAGLHNVTSLARMRL